MAAMSEPRPAWQPLTPRGVAAFADAPWRRLLVVQFVFAIFAAAAIVWFLSVVWFPVVTAAIRRLPDRGEIRAGSLDWTADSPQLLAGNHFLALGVDLEHSGQARSPAHVQVEFGRREARIISLFGYAPVRYPDRRWIVAFNRQGMEPWWGAWRPPILWLSAGAVIVGLLIIWAVLASLYAFPIWLAGFFANRELNGRQSWKLAGAALMPGALLMVAGIILYGLGVLDVVQLLAVTAAHYVVGWGFAIAAIFCRPKVSAPELIKGNPFATPELAKENPFAPPPPSPP